MEPIQDIIAYNLVNIRKERGLSLDKVSNLTGVSKAMLAQIEKGNSNPTVTTLWKIANGLQVSFSSFMKEIDKTKIEVVDLKAITPAVDDEGNYQVYSIFSFHPEKKFEIFSVHLQPGHTHQSEKHLGEEYILIQSGKLTLEIQGEKYTLSPNQFIHFKANVEHMYSNSGEEPVHFHNIIYYPE
ncbi:helix-turn-helix domain-containing protein [Oceanobacillus salinisoli]|uniref:helix-turn-helix domain-containing protein n=1 Tax=Oceanobacillus salinisoli TaxID=2678611 RepID=UPI0012E239ED|nr:XRE family transcriptional regulator [Oceanobacillus salinisoli]